MPTEIKKKIELEVVHVLFLDIVGYSKRLTNEQQTLIDQLNQVVRSSEEFQSAEAAGRLIKIPTGDGMALVFYKSPAQPVECALEISLALKTYPELRVRMGVHSGPVSAVTDLNDRTNAAGIGINTAQRVMDCGDAGHILLSQRVAEDLAQYGQWQTQLHDLGEVEVKHGVRVHVFNLYNKELGNPEVPEKLRQAKGQTAPAVAGLSLIFRQERKFVTEVTKTIMKIYSYRKSILDVIFTTALLIGVAHVQTSGVTTGSELESTGTITEYTPGSALVLDIGTAEPVQFKLSQNVVYADSDGTVLEAPGLSKNLRIRVY